MLRYGAAAMKAIPKLFSYRNDIDIFTEDEFADKEFYKELFTNLFKGKIKLNDITPLGSKSNVLAAYDSRDVKSSRRSYYIVDGDLELILDSNRKESKGLIILDSYCIENYLIDESAMTEYVYFCRGTEERKDISKLINYEKWLEANSTCLNTLFVHFAILRKVGGGPNLRNANEFFIGHKKQVILNIEKVNEYKEDVKRQIIEKLEENGCEDPQKEYEYHLENISKIWKNNNDTLLRIVSGKDYLIPLLQCRMNYCAGKGKSFLPTKAIKLFLAKNSHLKRLEFLKNRMK